MIISLDYRYCLFIELLSFTDVILKAILNNTTTLNTTIGDMLNDTWVLYGDVYEMWEEAVLLLQVCVYLYCHIGRL